MGRRKKTKNKSEKKNQNKITRPGYRADYRRGAERFM